MATCTCTALTEYNIPCTPSQGGIVSALFKGAGAPPEGQTTPTDITVEILPESSSINTVMTYDKYSNVKYWTTDITLKIGEYNTNEKNLVDNLPCTKGHEIWLTTVSGLVIKVQKAFIQTATFNKGEKIADASLGVLVFQSITKEAPAVETSNI